MSAAAERPLADLLAVLAARSPAPGGGSAAAWAGALAAALLEMSAAFAGDAEVAERASALREELLARGEQELHAYAPVLAAQRLPVSDPSRADRLSAALCQASEVPIGIVRAATEVAELAASVARESKPELRGDAVAGVLVAEAASRAAARLAEINLSDRAGDPRLSELAGLLSRAERARGSALDDR